MLPEAFLERMQGMLGEEYPAFLESFEREQYHALRLNVLKRGAEKAVLSGCARLSRVPWAENGYYYQEGDQPGRHPFHAAGVYYIQEPSAMAPAELLGAQPGERVLDLCAAPGGKSTQLAAKLKGRGFLLCNEIHPSRAKILSENIERMGVVNACVTNETPVRLGEAFPEFFDRVLVDAPCSGEGMFRKNDGACEEWSPENVRMCAVRQDEILDCAAGMLCPGGRLVYSTCTFAPEENEGSVSRFLRRHPEFRLLAVDAMEAEKERLGLKGCDGVPWYVENPAPGLEGTLRMSPHRIKGEGHFAAVMQKEGTLPEGCRKSAACGSLQALSGKDLGEFPQFCKESLRYAGEAAARQGVPGTEPEPSLPELPGTVPELLQAAVSGLPGAPRYIRFGDNLYLAPADMPGLRGLKVLRPGLHLGELKKNRFEPSHALALALSPQDVTHVWDLRADSPETAAYLGGQTFSAEGEKGWYLVCVDGFSIGWGKLAGGMMKNHYPRGLRVRG